MNIFFRPSYCSVSLLPGVSSRRHQAGSTAFTRILFLQCLECTGQAVHTGLGRAVGDRAAIGGYAGDARGHDVSPPLAFDRRRGTSAGAIRLTRNVRSQMFGDASS